MYTYCAMEKVGTVCRNGKPIFVFRNRKFKPRSKKYYQWQRLYKKDLTKMYVHNKDGFDVRQYYCDPDKTYANGYDHDFFHQLVAFLTAREKQLAHKLNGCFKYEFTNNEGVKASEKDTTNEGIKVSGTDASGKEITPFYLRSDQFGFSAPSEERKYPYDLFIKKRSNKEAAIDQVINWIATSRTLGGSFLWPCPFYFNYNRQRGGKVDTKRDHYIQDRVDLTLWELLYWYQDDKKRTILSSWGNKDPNLAIWLNHFGSFDTYIEFFYLDPFVRKTEQGLRPINILGIKDTSEPKWGDNGENPSPEIKSSLEIDKLERMLKFVNDGIKKRTKKITNLLNRQ